MFGLEGNGNRRSGTAEKILSFMNALNLHMNGWTEEKITYVQDVQNALEAGTISKHTMKTVYDEIKTSKTQDSYRDMYDTLRRNIDYAMILQGKITVNQPTNTKEVILSEYFGA